MKRTFELTNRYIILGTPLILFTLLINIYMAIASMNKALIGVLISLIVVVLMTAAFFAGWFCMVKSAVADTKFDTPNSIIKDFIPGVGEYFLPVLGSFMVILILNLVLLGLTYFAGMHFIGNPQIDTEALSKALVNTETLKQFLGGLSSSQLVKISLWNMLILSVMSINWFLVMFYPPVLFNQTKNPFKAYFISLKYLFSRYFLKNIWIFIVIFSINFMLSIFSALATSNIFLNFVSTLLNFYFICLVAVGIFLYAEKTFINPPLGQNVDTYI